MNVRRLRGNTVALTNSGELTLIPVGCGSAFSKVLYQNNMLVVKGNTHVMIDCGTRAPQALHEMGLRVTNIRTWLITHSHADHIGGLEEVMLMGRYFAKSKPDVVITEEYQDLLWDHSLSGANAFNETEGGRVLGFEDYWNVIRPRKLDEFERDTHEVNLGPLNIKIVRTRHYPQNVSSWRNAAYSVGVILDDRVLFTGDTQFDEEFIVEYDRRFNFESIFHDVQFFTGGIHTGLDEVVTLPASIKRRTLLMHYGDDFKAHRKRVSREGFAGFSRQRHVYTFS